MMDNGVVGTAIVVGSVVLAVFVYSVWHARRSSKKTIFSKTDTTDHD